MAKLEEFGVLLTRFRVRLPGRGLKGVFAQTQLAERAGFDHSYVNRLEGGERNPTFETVDRLGEALGLTDCELDELTLAAGFVPPHVFELLASETVVRDVLRLLQHEALPLSERETMLNVLNVLASNAREAITTSFPSDELAA